MNKALRTRLFAWWYLTIGIGFGLLGVYWWMLGARMWQIALRFVVGAGFVALGVLTWRSKT